MLSISILHKMFDRIGGMDPANFARFGDFVAVGSPPPYGREALQDFFSHIPILLGLKNFDDVEISEAQSLDGTQIKVVLEDKDDYQEAYVASSDGLRLGYLEYWEDFSIIFFTRREVPLLATLAVQRNHQFHSYARNRAQYDSAHAPFWARLIKLTDF